MVVRTARDAAEVAGALDLRHRVFCEEQGVDPAAEQDGRDRDALHVVAVEGNTVLGTCRLLLDGEVARLGRMAVERSARGRGVGRAVLGAAERSAAEAGARRVRLHAQIAVERLYRRGGYHRRGDPFAEQGIDHVAMEKVVA